MTIKVIDVVIYLFMAIGLAATIAGLLAWRTQSARAAHAKKLTVGISVSALWIGLICVFLANVGVALKDYFKVDLGRYLIDFKSPDSVTAATVDFINKTGSLVKVFWLDQNGDLNQYASLDANDHVDLQTYVGHRWLVTDAANKPLAIYTVTVPSAKIEIGSDKTK
jgi:hypothetical protein